MIDDENQAGRPALAESSHSNSARIPWTYRVNMPLRLLICAISAVIVVTAGTFAHRMGASRNIPIGIVLACVLVALSVWSARSRAGVAGLGLHLVCSGLPLVLFSMLGPGGSVLIVAGFNSSSIGWLGQHVGLVWIGAIVFIHLVLLVLPKRFFVMPEYRTSNQAL